MLINLWLNDVSTVLQELSLLVDTRNLLYNEVTKVEDRNRQSIKVINPYTGCGFYSVFDDLIT